MDLSEGRALAMMRCAREIAAGRAELFDSDSDRRLLAIREIGPWTVQCLGLYGRGDPDSLPAGDLGFVKLVGRLAGLGRRATVEEVEEYFAPYAPFRGLAGAFALVGWHKAIAQGPAAAPGGLVRRRRRQQLVGEHLARVGDVGDQAVVGHPAGERRPLLAVHLAEGLPLRGRSSGRVASISARVSGGIEALAGVQDRFGRGPGVGDRVLGALGERRDEQAELRRSSSTRERSATSTSSS